MMTFTANLPLLLADAGVKATLLLGLTATIAILMRRASAAARHLVWTLGLLGALSLPLLTQTLPRLDLALPSVGHTQTQLLPPLTPAALTEKAATMPSGPDASETAIRPVAAAEAPRHPSWPVFVLVIWLFGVGLTLTRLLAGLSAVRKIAVASNPITSGPLAASATAACRTLAIRRPIDFRQATAPDLVSVPMGWGCRRPTVVLPAEAAQWPPEQVRAALLHELAHVQRQDWLVQMFTHLICALYWFHPFVWLAAKQARQESEHASDDLVLEAGLGPAEYATYLLNVVRSARAFRAAPVAAVTLGRPSTLYRRVNAILAPHPRRQGRTPRMAALAVALAAIFACPLAALRPVAAAGHVSSELRGVLVVIDPGHGGRGTGGVGQGGVTEKALDLAIAERLCTELMRRGATVYMTREGDTFPTLLQRTQLANAKHADYFISVHCDMQLDSPAGSVVFYHGQQPLERRLAVSVSQEMHQMTNTSSHTASDFTRFRAGFAVLRGAKMPAVLVECGSMIIPHDLARLGDTEGQQRIAEGIAAGLSVFQESRRKT